MPFFYYTRSPEYGEISTRYLYLYRFAEISSSLIQGGFLTVPRNFQYQNEKRMGSQSEILFHEILDVKKILVG